MTSPDFFSELDAHLDAAARRQARLGRLAGAPIPRRSTVVGFAVVACVVALAVGLLPALGARLERSEPAATPVPTVLECARPAPPQRLLESFEVLRRERTAADELPASVVAMLESGEGEPIAPVWNRHARLARTENNGGREGDRYFVVPVVMGRDCVDGKPAPDVGVCLAIAVGDDGVIGPTCTAFEEVVEEGLRIAAGPTFLGEGLDGVLRARFEFLVPDGSQPAVVVGGDRIRAGVQGNVAVVQVRGTERALNRATVVLQSESATEPEVECSVSGEGVPASLSEDFWVLRRSAKPADRPSEDDLRRLYEGTNTPDATFKDFLSVTLQMEPYLEGLRLLHADGARRAYLIPVSRLDSRECGVSRERPGRDGLCVTELGDRRPSGGFCTTPKDVRAAKAIYADDPGRVYGLAPDGVRAVRIEWRDGRPPSEVPVVSSNYVSGKVADGDIYAALQDAKVTFVR